jgi:hypothetical protein
VNDALAHERLADVLELIDRWGDLYNRRWGKRAHHEHPELASQCEHTAKTHVAHICRS